MNAFAKVMVVFILLLSAGFAVAQMVLHSKREKYQELYQTCLEDYRNAARAAEKWEGKHTALTNTHEGYKKDTNDELGRRERKLEGQATKIAELEGTVRKKDGFLAVERERTESDKVDLLEQSTQIVQLEKANSDLKIAVQDAKRKIKELDDTVLAMDKSITALGDDVKKLKEGLKEVVAQRDDLDALFKELVEKGFALPPFPDIPVLDAKVVKVDQKLNVVVINKGKKDRVRMNFPFTIYRGASFVAKVYVVEVQPEHCLARVEAGMGTDKKMQVGDNATTRTMY